MILPDHVPQNVYTHSYELLLDTVQKEKREKKGMRNEMEKEKREKKGMKNEMEKEKNERQKELKKKERQKEMEKEKREMQKEIHKIKKTVEDVMKRISDEDDTPYLQDSDKHVPWMEMLIF